VQGINIMIISDGVLDERPVLHRRLQLLDLSLQPSDADQRLLR